MTKDLVLEILRQKQDYISGEKISTQLGISRAAVNTAVKSLRASGYDIRSSTNKGYCLHACPDALTARELSAFLPSERMEIITCLDSVDSTNNQLRALAFSGAPDGQVVLANEQTNGRGRRGREFLSPRDKGIYLSMLLRPDSLPTDIAEITAWAAVAVINAIETLYGIAPGIKWVNDLVLGGKKVCGILTESFIESETGYVQHVLVGVGINVTEQAFPQDLSKIATSLSMESDRSISRAKLAAQVIQELDHLRSSWPREREKYLAAYRRRDITVGRDIVVLRGDSRRNAVAISIDDHFALNVRYQDGSCETLSSGEVSICGLYGQP